MILDHGQARRFCGLYGSLLAYVNRRLGVVRRDGRALDEREQLQVARVLWGESGMRSLVEDFVLENPADLPRTDLKEALAWKSALWGPCVVLRDGADTLFLHDEYAFAVCGLSTEIHQLLSRAPAFVNTVLLPFDGLVTYGLSLEEYLLDMPDDMAATAARDVAAMRARGHVVSTAADFAGVAPRVGERRLELEAERFALQMELDMNADELGPGQHRGALAGLSWARRESAVAEHLHPDPADKDADTPADEPRGDGRRLMFEVADDLCVPGEPADALADVLAHFDRRRLLQASRVLGLRPGAVAGGAARGSAPADGARRCDDTRALAAAMAERIPLDADSLLRPARLDGVGSLLDLHRLVDAGGRIDVADAEVATLADLVKPLFPLTFLFHADGTFSCVMPREVRHALADVDWDAEVDRAMAVEEAVHYLDMLVDLCGVISIEDAVADYEAYYVEDHADVATVVEAVLHAADAETACFELIELDDDPYLVSYEAVRPPSGDADDAVLARFLRDRDDTRGRRGAARGAEALPGTVDVARDSAEAHDRHREEIARRLVAAHGTRGPRPLTDDLLSCDDVATWVLRQPPAQALTAYLDAHVPDGADDYRFADRVVERIVAASRDLVAPTTIIEYLRAEGFVPTDAQLFRLFDLVMELTSAVPKWSNNGWPPLDVVPAGV